MKKLLFALAVHFLLAGTAIQAQKSATSAGVQNFLRPESLAFTENKGQLADETGRLLPDIQYYGNQAGVHVYLRANRLSFVFTKINPEDEPKAGGKSLLRDNFQTPLIRSIETSRMDMNLIGANPMAEIHSEEIQPAYTNYYLGHTPEAGITNVKSYQKLTCKSIYPLIDLIIKTGKIQTPQGKGGLEYEFIVHPGGNPSDIQLQWSGTQPQLKPDGSLSYHNDLGEMTEGKPISFTSTGTVESSFQLRKGIVDFHIGQYDLNQDLVIDPALVWGTYFGGTGDDRGSNIATDKSGNVYLTGETKASTGLATSGAFQTTNAGNIDAFIAKYSTTGTLLWSTYYGGTDYDYGSRLTTDISGVYLIGSSGSTGGMATSGAYQTSNAGYYDAFIARFNANGSRTWATLFGGSSAEGAANLVIDSTGDLYLSGNSASFSGIATTGAYRTANAGSTDAYLAKFTSSGSILWATYFGGSDNDYVNAMTLTPTAVYFVGPTQSSSGIASSGAYRTTWTGSYIAKFDLSGNFGWSTYYGAANSNLYGIVSDKAGSIFVTGMSNNSTGIATSGTYQTSLAGNEDVVISKFSLSGSMLWGTYYGGSDLDQGRGIALDSQERIIITGQTKSKTGMATSNAWQTNNNGGTDAFIAMFSNTGIRVFSSYYGGKNEDLGIGVATVSGPDVYFSGYSSSDSGISTTGAAQNTRGGSYDAFLAKCTFPPPGKIIVNAGNDTTVCRYTMFTFGYPPVPGYSYSWKTKYGYIANTSSFKMQVSKSETYYLTVTDSYFNTGTDSIYIKINPVPNRPYTCGDTFVCMPQKISVHAYDNGPYRWYDSGIGGNLLDTTADYSFYVNKSDTLYLSGYNGLCEIERDTLRIHFDTIHPNPIISSNSPLCVGDTLKLKATTVPGIWYVWNGPNGFSAYSQNAIVKPGKKSLEGMYYFFNGRICGYKDSVFVKVRIPDAGFRDSSIAYLTYGFAAKDTGLKSYDWTLGDGNTESKISFSHKYPYTGMFPVTLKVTDSLGCSNKVTNSVLIKYSNIEESLNNTNLDAIRLYPNPFTETTKITYNLDRNAKVSIRLTDLLGKEIFNIEEGQKSAGEYSYNLQSADWKLQSGLYMLRISVDDEVYVRQIVKLK